MTGGARQVSIISAGSRTWCGTASLLTLVVQHDRNGQPEAQTDLGFASAWVGDKYVEPSWPGIAPAGFFTLQLTHTSADVVQAHQTYGASER